MIHIAIVADDLTGAAETAAAFSPGLPANRLVAHEALRPEGLPAGLELLSVYTNSRGLPPAEASARLRETCAGLRPLDPGLVYKKIDSSLRGNIGAELDAVLDALGMAHSVVAPAYPAMGRTTRDGVHRIHGQPVGESEAARDPVAPVRESRLPEIVARQSRYPVAHVPERFLGDAGGLAAEMGRLVRAGARHVTVDAGSEEHLDCIVQAGLSRGRKVLFVGAAGLAERLAQQVSPPRPPGWEVPRACGRPRLLVCGTASEHTRRQIERLVAVRSYRLAEFDPDFLQQLDEAAIPDLVAKLKAAAQPQAVPGLVVRIAAGCCGKERLAGTGLAERVARGLGILAARLLPALAPACLFLSGGDTASEVLAAARADALRIRGAAAPGIIGSEVVGGPHHALPVFTKPGAFGTPEDLVNLDRSWDDPGRRLHP